MKKLKTGLTKKSYSLKFLQYGLRQDDYEENKSTRLDTCIITCMETRVECGNFFSSRGIGQLTKGQVQKILILGPPEVFEIKTLSHMHQPTIWIGLLKSYLTFG